jgi:hypothetical protein
MRPSTVLGFGRLTTVARGQTMASRLRWNSLNRLRRADALALVAIVAAFGSAWAASTSVANETEWIAPSIGALQRMPHDREAEGTKQVTPPILRGYSVYADPAGAIGTFMPGGSVIRHHIDERVFSRSRFKRSDLPFLPPTAERMGNERQECAR